MILASSRLSANRGIAIPSLLAEPIDSLAGGRGGHDIDIALLVLTEREDGSPATGSSGSRRPGAGRHHTAGPEPTGHVIGVEIGTFQFRQTGASIDGTAGDRLAGIEVEYSQIGSIRSGRGPTPSLRTDAATPGGSSRSCPPW